MPVDPAGVAGPTRGQAAGPRWRRTSRGFHVPSWVDGSLPEQRVMEQSVRLPAGGAVTGWAALRLHGGGFFDGLAPDGRTPFPVPLALGPRGDVRPDASVVLDRDRLDPQEVVVRRGIACTRVPRALFDAMRRRENRREAVVDMDMAAAAELTSLRRQQAYVATRAGWTGVAQVRWALALASEHSRSPNESRMRLVWLLDAGLPPPLVNQPVHDRAGRLLGVADLLDVEAGLVGEFDGADHRGATQHSRDVGREERFRRAGLEMFHVTGPDLHDTRLVARRMLSSRARARWLAPTERRWVVEPPRGSESEWTLDERLDHRDWLAACWAAWEAPPA